MSFTPWTSALGVTQGRAIPTDWVAPEGSYVFVLGTDAPGVYATLAAGDYAEVSQAGTFEGATAVHFKAHVRHALHVPGGVVWRASVLIDGVEVIGRNITRDRTFLDFAWDLSTYDADAHLLAFRLTLVAAAGTYEVELPGFYVDEIIFDSPAVTPGVRNRDPEPNDTGVPADQAISIDLEAYGAAPLDLAATNIYVNSVLAYAGGTFQTGFDGAGSVTATPQADTTRVVIDPTVDFGSTEVVTVEVRTRVVGDPLNQVDTTYTYTTADTVGPMLVSAVAIDQKIVRLVFDSALDIGVGGTADALTAANYAFSRTAGQLAVSVVATSVASVAPTTTTVDVTTDIELTPGALYTVAITGVQDLSGNAADTGGSFLGYAPARPADRDFDLLSMLPVLNVAEDISGDLTKFVGCFQEVTDLLLSKIDRFTDLADPDTCPPAFLDDMLADLGNPFTFSLTDEDKRRLIRVLVAIYNQKFTDPGIINAIRFFQGIEVTISTLGGGGPGLGDAFIGDTWVLGSGSARDRISFSVVVPRVLTPDEIIRMTAIVRYMKYAPTHFVGITQPSPPPPTPDHMELGLSELGVEWTLH